MKIECISALDKIKKLPDNSQDIIFAYPPYALGSTVYIDKDGKPKYKEAKDFMNKWDMPDHNFWQEFFSEANRVLKFGGRILLFGIDRQLMLFQYYATMGGLETKQSLYYAFGSSFPKATDLSKNIDKRLGAEREFVGIDEEKLKKMAGSCFGQGVYLDSGFNSNNLTAEGGCTVTKSTSELGKKYEGWKYSVAPLKQSVETIMVFQKPTKNKSVLDDVFAYEDGDLSISPSIWNIDGGRIALSDDRATKGYQHKAKAGLENGSKKDNQSGDVQELYNKNGRYPSQLLIDETIAESIDKQTGTLSSAKSKSPKKAYVSNSRSTALIDGITTDDNQYGDSGGGSRFYHNIKLLDEDLDLLNYFSKVSGSERNYGLDAIEDKDREPRGNNQGTRVCVDCGLTDNGINKHSDCSGEYEYKLCAPLKNNHPTLKPLMLCSKIATLLKSPNPQNAFFPFAGSGSEIIGFISAGYDKELFEASELSQEYIDIAHERIKAWEKVDFEKYKTTKAIKEKPEPKDDSLDEWC